MTLAYLAVLIYARYTAALDMLSVSCIALMLEHVTMGLLLVVVFALMLDIHIKKSNE